MYHVEGFDMIVHIFFSSQNYGFVRENGMLHAEGEGWPLFCSLKLIFDGMMPLKSQIDETF